MYARGMLTCPACSEENPARARFCLACGAGLPAEHEAPREERKLVSVLFCDLVGFTARSDNADPEDVRATLRPYHARLRADIERFGGTVEKFIGDAVMAVFGAPVAHEDDAERAVRAAVRIIGSIAEMNDERPGLDLSVRIGVNTGEAVVSLGARAGDGEGIVTGDVVNTAARLQAVAPVNGVIVGQMTFRATRDWVEYEALEPVVVKGKAEPVEIWRALAARSRFGIDVDQATRTPFVGRENEFALLSQTFARAVAEPSVQLVTITGEPGVGKSRLLWELRRHLDDCPELVFWRQGRCLPYGEGVTYWALGEMVKAQAGVLESDPPGLALEKLRTAVAAVSEDEAESDWLRGRLAPLVGVGGADQRDSRDEAFTAWVRFLESIAARNPLVLVFEDLHWADGPLVEFVEHLVEWSSGVPLLVVCTARPELYERHPGWGGGSATRPPSRSPRCRSRTPPGCSRRSWSRRCCRPTSWAISSSGPGAIRSTRRSSSGCSPTEGSSSATGRHSGPSPTRVACPSPRRCRPSIGARLDTLSVDRKSLLQNASVVGKVFWSGAVASMAAVGEGPAREALHDLARKELVRTVRTSSVQDQAEYAFWHALVRDVAYGQIPRAERAAKHLSVAAWMEFDGRRADLRPGRVAGVPLRERRSSCRRRRAGTRATTSGPDGPRPRDRRRAGPAPGRGEGAGLLPARGGAPAGRGSGAPDAPRQDPRRGGRPRRRVQHRAGGGLRGGDRAPPPAGRCRRRGSHAARVRALPEDGRVDPNAPSGSPTRRSSSWSLSARAASSRPPTRPRPEAT